MEVPGVGPAEIPQDHRYPGGEATAGPKPNLIRGLAHNQEDLNRLLEILENTFFLFNRRLKFSVNREINRVVVKVIDRNTDKVIKEIPPEDIQKLVARIREAIGLLVDERI